MTNDELAQKYIELSMDYEEIYPVECGFAAATKARLAMVDKIKYDNVSQKDLAIIEPVFLFGNINIRQYLKPRKRFFIF